MSSPDWEKLAQEIDREMLRIVEQAEEHAIEEIAYRHRLDPDELDEKTEYYRAN